MTFPQIPTTHLRTTCSTPMCCGTVVENGCNRQSQVRVVYPRQDFSQIIQFLWLLIHHHILVFVFCLSWDRSYQLSCSSLSCLKIRREFQVYFGGFLASVFSTVTCSITGWWRSTAPWLKFPRLNVVSPWLGSNPAFAWCYHKCTVGWITSDTSLKGHVQPPGYRSRLLPNTNCKGVATGCKYQLPIWWGSKHNNG